MFVLCLNWSWEFKIIRIRKLHRNPSLRIEIFDHVDFDVFMIPVILALLHAVRGFCFCCTKFCIFASYLPQCRILAGSSTKLAVERMPRRYAQATGSSIVHEALRPVYSSLARCPCWPVLTVCRIDPGPRVSRFSFCLPSRSLLSTLLSPFPLPPFLTLSLSFSLSLSCSLPFRSGLSTSSLLSIVRNGARTTTFGSLFSCLLVRSRWTRVEGNDDDDDDPNCVHQMKDFGSLRLSIESDGHRRQNRRWNRTRRMPSNRIIWVVIRTCELAAPRLQFYARPILYLLRAEKSNEKYEYGIM